MDDGTGQHLDINGRDIDDPVCFPLMRDEDNFYVTVSADEAKANAMSETRGGILQIIEDAGSEGIVMKDIIEEMKEMGIYKSDGATHQAVRRMKAPTGTRPALIRLDRNRRYYVNALSNLPDSL